MSRSSTLIALPEARVVTDRLTFGGRSVVSGCATWFGPILPPSLGAHGEPSPWASVAEQSAALSGGTAVALRFCTRPLDHVGECRGPVLRTMVSRT